MEDCIQWGMRDNVNNIQREMTMEMTDRQWGITSNGELQTMGNERQYEMTMGMLDSGQ